MPDKFTQFAIGVETEIEKLNKKLDKQYEELNRRLSKLEHEIQSLARKP